VKNLLSVRCLMIDFSKALDRVSHPILLSKLSKLELLDRAINWIISYLTGRTHVVKCNRGVFHCLPTVPILSVFPALIVHSELKSVHPGFPVAFIF